MVMYNNNTRPFLYLALLWLLSSWSWQAQAQLVNMEETWQEFLVNKKTSNVSQLPEPDKRTQPTNYLKYALISANTSFCGDNISRADELMASIEAMGSEVWLRIPGFQERYLGLKENIAAYKKLDPLWRRFKTDKTSVSREEVERYPGAARLCERGTLTKYYYMVAHDHLCERDLRQARSIFDTRIKRLVATTFDPYNVEGLGEEVTKMTQYWMAMDEMEPAWEAYSRTDISPGMTAEMPVFRCYIQPNIKAYLLKAMHNICKDGEPMLEKIQLLQRQTGEKLPSDIIDKIDELEARVKAIRTDLVVLNTYWKKFVANGNTPAEGAVGFTYECDREAEIKAYLMAGFAQPCVTGQKALDNIATIRREHRPELGSTTAQKIKALKALVTSSTGDVDVLNEAWADFAPDGKLSQTYRLDFDFCEKLAELKAHLIQGTVEQCTEGQQRLDLIDDLLVEYEIEVPTDVQTHLNGLKASVAGIAKRQQVMDQAWNHFRRTSQVSDDYEYENEFPCNRVLDVRAAILDGYTNPCLSGQYGLDEAQKLTRKYNITLDQETADFIQSLRNRLAEEGTNVKKVTRIWKDFVPDNQIQGALDVPFDYCDKIAECRAYILDGTLNFCDRGESRLQDIYQLREDYLLALDDEMESKLEQLYLMVERGKPSTTGLERAWARAVASDNFYKEDHGDVEINAFYCNPTDQVKTWVLQGLMSACSDGQTFLDKVAVFKRERGLVFDEELEYQVELLQVYVGRCE